MNENIGLLKFGNDYERFPYFYSQDCMRKTIKINWGLKKIKVREKREEESSRDEEKKIN